MWSDSFLSRKNGDFKKFIHVGSQWVPRPMCSCPPNILKKHLNDILKPGGEFIEPAVCSMISAPWHIRLLKCQTWSNASANPQEENLPMAGTQKAAGYFSPRLIDYPSSAKGCSRIDSLIDQNDKTLKNAMKTLSFRKNENKKELQTNDTAPYQAVFQNMWKLPAFKQLNGRSIMKNCMLTLMQKIRSFNNLANGANTLQRWLDKSKQRAENKKKLICECITNFWRGKRQWKPRYFDFIIGIWQTCPAACWAFKDIIFKLVVLERRATVFIIFLSKRRENVSPNTMIDPLTSLN